MECPDCDRETKQKVIDKRNNGPNGTIRRRRECCECGTRWTTYEVRFDCISFEDDVYEEYDEEEYE